MQIERQISNAFNACSYKEDCENIIKQRDLLRNAIETIVANARMAPDPFADGADCFMVPLEDIECIAHEALMNEQTS